MEVILIIKTLSTFSYELKYNYRIVVTSTPGLYHNVEYLF